MATKGRLQLLQWLNELTDCDYSKVELCADGVGYCQIIDALHNGAINLSRLNLNARYYDECARNLKVLDEALVKLKVKEVFSFEKMAKGRFQDNMHFLQWLYGYALKMGPQHISYYKGYQRRLQALDRQRKDVNEMAPHLIPNQAFFPDKQEEFEGEPPENQEQDDEEVEYEDVLLEKRSNQNAEFIKDLEADLKNRMERNWKLMHSVDRVVEQRNMLHTKLQEIERILCKHSASGFKQKLIDILLEVPDDFKSG